jgi:hypothetical protein
MPARKAKSHETSSGGVASLSRAACLACGSPRLKLLFLLEADDPPAAFAGRQVAIVRCLDCGSGQVDRKQHDSFDWDSVHDQSEQYLMVSRDAQKLEASAAICPAPLAAECDCPAHRSLRASCPAFETCWYEELAGTPRVRVRSTRGVPKLSPFSGYVRLRSREGRVVAEGEVRDGRREGRWTLWRPDGGARAEGDFRRDRKQGG